MSNLGDEDHATTGVDLLAAIPDPAAIVENGRISECNDAFRRTTGVDSSDGVDPVELVEGGSDVCVRDLFAGKLSPDRRPVYGLHLADGSSVPYEFAVDNIDGGDQLLVIARPVPDGDHEQHLNQEYEMLETVAAVNSTVYEAIQALTHAASRKEVEQIVCEELANASLYECAWIGRADDDTEPAVPDVVAGADEQLIEMVREIGRIPDRPFSPRVALETGETQISDNLLEADHEVVRESARRLNTRSVLAVPLTYRDTTYGVLVICSSRGDAFCERETAAIDRLADAVGFVIGAIQAERLLLSDAIIEVTLRTDDSLAASLSTAADGIIELKQTIPTEEGTYRHYISIEGIDDATVRDIAAERAAVTDCTRIGSTGDRAVYEIEVTDCLCSRLLEYGGTARSIVAESGTTTFVIELPPTADIPGFLEAAEKLYDIELVSKRRVEPTPTSETRFGETVAESLSNKNDAVLRHALHSGYFDWPRETTVEELAERFDVSDATLHYHLRRAQRELATAYIDYLDN
ncbi:MAG: bacterio-opsin activator domain-containing protein [Natronomonas sp.]